MVPGELNGRDVAWRRTSGRPASPRVAADRGGRLWPRGFCVRSRRRRPRPRSPRTPRVSSRVMPRRDAGRRRAGRAAGRARVSRRRIARLRLPHARGGRPRSAIPASRSTCWSGSASTAELPVLRSSSSTSRSWSSASTHADLEAFVDQYHGLDVHAPVAVARAGRGANQVDAVSGATISSTVINDAIIRAARAVARSRGLFGEAPIDLVGHEWPTGRPCWPTARCQRLELTRRAKSRRRLPHEGRARIRRGRARGPPPSFGELYFALATPARIGRNLLGDQLFNRAVAELTEGDQLIFVGGRGLYSFKGTAWRRERHLRAAAAGPGRADVSAERGAASAESTNSRSGKRRSYASLRCSRYRKQRLCRRSAVAPGAAGRGKRPASDEPAYASFAATYVLPERYLQPASAPRAGRSERAAPLWQQVWDERTGRHRGARRRPARADRHPGVAGYHRPAPPAVVLAAPRCSWLSRSFGSAGTRPRSSR